MSRFGKRPRSAPSSHTLTEHVGYRPGFELLSQIRSKILDGDFRPSFSMDLVAPHGARPFIARLRVPQKSQIRPGG